MTDDVMDLNRLYNYLSVIFNSSLSQKRERGWEGGRVGARDREKRFAKNKEKRFFLFFHFLLRQKDFKLI